MQMTGTSYEASHAIIVDDEPIFSGIEWSGDKHLQGGVANMVIQLIEGQQVWVSPYFTAGAKGIWGQPGIRETWFGATFLYPN